MGYKDSRDDVEEDMKEKLKINLCIIKYKTLLLKLRQYKINHNYIVEI